jgi:hypothetical protein
VQGYSIEGVLREDARVTITFKNNPTPETKTLAAWRADTRITNPEIPEIPVSFANQVNGSTPVVSQEEAIAETIKKIKGFTRIYETETWTPNPISKTEIRRFLIEAGFSGTPEQLDQAIVQVGAKVNSTSGINPRQVVTAVPGVGPFIDGIADTADLVNGARVVAADELERAADVARTLGNNDLALTLEGQAQILRRGDVVIDDSAGVSLQTVEQRLGRSLSNDERQFVSEALNAQQSTDAHFTEIAQRLGGQYVAPSEDEIHRIVDRGLKSQRGSDSFTLIDSSREPADLSEAIRKIQYSSDGLPVNIQWYAPGDATPYAISRFDIGGYIIRPAIRVEDPNYIT